jgi:hypothetical protein
VYILLHEPHLTSCCGKHLSQEAATKKQGDGEPCPHCNTAGWSTVLNRHFHRQVNSLRVFCRYEESGCEWQGELRDLDSHPCTVSNQEKEMEEKQKNQVSQCHVQHFGACVCIHNHTCILLAYYYQGE